MMPGKKLFMWFDGKIPKSNVSVGQCGARAELTIESKREIFLFCLLACLYPVFCLLVDSVSNFFGALVYSSCSLI